MRLGQYVTAEEIEKEHSRLSPAVDALLVDIDWRREEPRADGQAGARYFYPRALLNFYLNFVRLMSLAAYISLPYHAVGSYNANIIGVLFTGGRDLHPRFYNEEVNGTRINEASETRYPFALEQYRWAKGRLPIMGICWGSQLLVVAGGGALEQHLPNAEEHVMVYNLLRVRKNSWFRTAIASAKMMARCNHHQGYKRIPANFSPMIWDSQKMIHGFESTTGMLELGLLFHPERLLNDPHSRRIAVSFGKLCLAVNGSKRETARGGRQASEEEEEDEEDEDESD